MREVKTTSIKQLHFAQSPDCLCGEIKNSHLSEQEYFTTHPSYGQCYTTEAEMRKIWISKHGKMYASVYAFRILKFFLGR